MKHLIGIAAILFLVALIALHRPMLITVIGRPVSSKTLTGQHDRFMQEWEQRTPVPTPTPDPAASARPNPWATYVAATATAWRTWSATMQAEVSDKIDREQATLQAQIAATMTAQPTYTPKPTATPMPLKWDVTVLDHIEHYEQLAEQAGYRGITGLVAGEQWLIVKLRVTYRGRGESSPFSGLRATTFLIGGTGRHANYPPLSCALSYHPLDAARLAAIQPGIEREFISVYAPLLAPYHGFPNFIDRVAPGVPTEGWFCFGIRDEAVPGVQLAMGHPDGVNVTTWALTS